MTDKDTKDQNPLTPDANSGNNGAGPQNGGGQDPETPPTPVSPEVPEWFANDPVAAYKELEKARKEAAEYRTIKKKEEEQRQTAMEKQGEYQALYEQLKAKHEPAAEKLEAYEQAFQKVLTNRLKSVPESIHELLKGRDPLDALAWLEAHANEFQPKPAPQFDAGVQGDRPESVNLTAEQLKMAQQFGVDPKRLAEEKRRLLG